MAATLFYATNGVLYPILLVDCGGLYAPWDDIEGTVRAIAYGVWRFHEYMTLCPEVEIQTNVAMLD